MLRFNFYYSVPFWASFILIAFFSRFLDLKPKYRGYFLLASSSFLVLAIPQFTLFNFFLLLTISSFSFLIGYALNHKSLIEGHKKRRRITVTGITAVLAFLAFFKYRFIQAIILKGQLLPSTGPIKYIFLIGVSYFSFKMIHFIVESYRKKIDDLTILNYLNYMLFFPPFISGPINRYNHFSSQINYQIKTNLKSDLKLGGERIIHGLFKKFVLVQILYPHILGNQAKPFSQLSIYEVAFSLYAYAFYFYFDFSGYSDLAIGTARILGIGLPENFNNPFLKRNIRELWMNWHMSLTGWLVDYIYWPLVRKIRNVEFFREHPVSLSNVSMIITFIICGMWHGETLNFIIWGAYHGIGISIVNIYQREKRGIKNESIRRYFRSKYSNAAGVFLTFNFFVFGLSLFVLDIDKIKILFSKIFSGL